jgi:hypothetical protein
MASWFMAVKPSKWLLKLFSKKSTDVAMVAIE